MNDMGAPQSLQKRVPAWWPSLRQSGQAWVLTSIEADPVSARDISEATIPVGTAMMAKLSSKMLR